MTGVLALCIKFHESLIRAGPFAKVLEKRSRQEIHSDLQAGVRLTTFSPTMNVGRWCKSKGEELKSQHLFNPFLPGNPLGSHTQTVQTLIRRHIMWHLFRVYIVC